jgi:ABC-type molybdenum transport system ATPase subunit/photorepair protein PhrA
MAHHEYYQRFSAATYAAENFLTAFKELDACIFGSVLEGEEAAVLLHRARVLHLMLDEAIAKIDKAEEGTDGV